MSVHICLQKLVPTNPNSGKNILNFLIFKPFHISCTLQNAYLEIKKFSLLQIGGSDNTSCMERKHWIFHGPFTATVVLC